jgi:uncharacterized membrane protein
MNSHFVVALFHVLVISPFLLYVFFNRASNPEWIYTTLLIVGLFVLVYHAYKSLVKYYAKSSSLWVNIFHVVGLAPLLIYIGYNGKKTERPAYEILGILSFGALGYHLYNMIVMLQVHDDHH